MFECEASLVEELTYVLSLQVNQIRESIYISQVKFRLEKKRGTIGNCMNKSLLLLLIRKHSNVNFLSLMVITTQEIKHIIPILINFKNFFMPTHLNNDILLIYSLIIHLSLSLSKLSNSLKMSQKSDIAKISKPKLITNSYGFKMLRVEIGKKETQKTRVSDSRNSDDELIMIMNPKPLQMVVLVDNSIKRNKIIATKKKLSSEKVNTNENTSYIHVHNTYEYVNINEEGVSNPVGKIINHTKRNIEELLVEQHVESHVDSHVEPNVKICVLTSSEPLVEPSKPVVDIPIFDTRFDDISSEN